MWNLFVERYRPVLVAVGQRLGLGPEDAQDVAQQTLMEFVRDLGRGRFDRSRGRLRTWMLAILRHRVVDLQRLRGGLSAAGVSSGPPSDDSLAMEVADPAAEEAVERLWQAAVDRRVIDMALGQLRGDRRVAAKSLEAFELTVLHEVPPEAAAKACGMTINAVYIARSRVAARLRRLVDLLAPAYEEEPPRRGPRRPGPDGDAP